HAETQRELVATKRGRGGHASAIKPGTCASEFLVPVAYGPTRGLVDPAGQAERIDHPAKSVVDSGGVLSATISSAEIVLFLLGASVDACDNALAVDGID